MQPKRLRPFAPLALVAAFCSSDLQGQSPSRKVRTINLSGERIAASLRADDEIVEIAPFGEGASHLRQPPRVLLENAVRIGGVSIVRVAVTGVSGVLTDEGTFVKTQLVGTIVEVLHVGKNRTARTALAVGRPVEFTVAGGEVAIGGVVVRSSVLVVYPYPAEYVVALDQLQHENGWSVSLSPPLRVEGNDLEPVAPQKSWLTGLNLLDMRNIIKASR